MCVFSFLYIFSHEARQRLPDVARVTKLNVVTLPSEEIVELTAA